MQSKSVRGRGLEGARSPEVSRWAPKSWEEANDLVMPTCSSLGTKSGDRKGRGSKTVVNVYQCIQYINFSCRGCWGGFVDFFKV